MHEFKEAPLKPKIKAEDLRSLRSNMSPATHARAQLGGSWGFGPQPFLANERKCPCGVPSLFQKGHFPLYVKNVVPKMFWGFAPSPRFCFIRSNHTSELPTLRSPFVNLQNNIQRPFTGAKILEGARQSPEKCQTFLRHPLLYS